MQKLNNEYIELLQRNNKASQNFWDLERRIFKDKKVSVYLLIWENQWWYRIDVIKFDDLDEFSEELKNEIQFMIDR